MAEETGLKVSIYKELGITRYSFSRRRPGQNMTVSKTVTFYLMKHHGGSTEEHDDEVLSAQWLSAAEAIARLSFPSEQDLARKALEILELGD